MGKVRVLRIINRFNLGGPTYNATYLTAFLGEEFETLLVGGRHGEEEGDSTYITEKYNVEYQIIDELQREINFKQDHKAYKKIRKLIQEFKPDVVHTHASKAGFLGRLAASKENVPVVVHTFHGHVFHSYFGKLKTNLYKYLERRMAKKSDAIIAISEIQKKELSEVHRIAPAHKFRVIQLGFDLERFKNCKLEYASAFREKYDIKDDSVTISMIGRLVPIKNHKWVIDRICEVRKKVGIDFNFLIIGDGEMMGELKRYAGQKQEGLGEQFIIFTSWIKDVAFALGGSDVVVLGSLNEGTPVSLIEAQASGTPVISTNVGGVKDIVMDGETGFVVDDFDEKEFEHKLTELISSQEKREKMSQNGWTFVENKFGYNRLCKETAELYQNLLKTKK